MVKQITRGKDIARNTYWSAVGMAAATMLAVQPVFADTIWDRFSTILNWVFISLPRPSVLKWSLPPAPPSSSAFR